MKFLISFATILVFAAQFNSAQETCNEPGEPKECFDNQSCVTLEGQYEMCLCNIGYKLNADKTACEEIICDTGCASGQVCANLSDGTTTCVEEPTTTNTTNAGPNFEGSCTDDTECGVGGKCVEHPKIGKYCQCQDGYGYNETTAKCQDVNQCSPNPCGARANCTEGTGMYICSCPDGQIYIDGKCQGINTAYCGNETCDSNTEECVTSYSQNGYPTTSCKCKTGFFSTGSGASQTCQPYDQCEAFGDADCKAQDSNSQCVFEDWEVKCVCQKGYEVKTNQTTCSDIDECASLKCGTNEECKNTTGKTATEGVCECITGYWHNGTGCVADTVCPTVEDCHANATCFPTVEGYECRCNEDYVGDGKEDCFECAPRIVEIKASSGIISLHTFDGVIKSLFITAIVLVLLSNFL